MKLNRESFDPKYQSEQEKLVRFYCENEKMLRQAIKDFENRIAEKTESLEKDKDVFKLLIAKLNSCKRNRD